MLQQIIVAEMDAPCCSSGPTRHRISSRISGVMRSYLGKYSESPNSNFLTNIMVIAVFISLRKYQPHVKASLSSLLLPSHLHRNSNCLDLQKAQHNYHRHWTSLPFLLNHVHWSLTTLLLRIILAHTLAKISDDAGAFILRSLVSASQRRQARITVYSR